MKTVFTLLIVGLFIGCSSPSTEIVKTIDGDLKGYEKENVNYFLGIPFAEAPVGDLRWKPPAPTKKWVGVREATEFGAACMQPTNIGNSLFLELMLDGFGLAWHEKLIINVLAFLNFGQSTEYSEDCLFLNVIAPKEAENLPVMFWIHGGASRFGSGGESIYLTSKFAEKDVILVTTNYRLGSLGWFAHPRLSAESENNVSGNYGSLDMIAALKWVKNNIRAFGGDPSNVTIFGESAGGQAVGTLLASPFTKGLFHKAISQSGSGIFTTRNLRDDSKLISAEKIGMALADHFGIENNDSTLENLRNIPASEFVQLSDPIKDQELIGSMAQVVDGFFFPERFHDAYRNGTTHNIPYITGFNANEGTSLFPLFTPKEIFNQTISSDDWLNEFWQSQNVFTDKADSDVPDELREYEKSLGLNPYKSATQIWGDFFFGGPAYYAAQKRSEDDLTTYMYLFDRAVPSEKQTLGATHALELAYLFGSFFPFVAKDAWDEELSEIMVSDWTYFAKNGEPKRNWPKFSATNPVFKIYGDKVFESKLDNDKLFRALAEDIDLNL